MAITKTIEIDVNSQNAVDNLDKINKSLDNQEESVKSLKQQYKEAALEVQRLAEEFGSTSQQAAEAAKRAAELKDKIEDSNDAIAAFKGEGTFNATAKAVGAVASGFSAVEGAMALAGVQSEEFEKTMIRLQGAMALAQGLQGLEDVGRSFKQLKTVAVNALNGIKNAIGATGIGLLVIALGTIYAYWDDIKGLVGGVTEEQQQLNEAVDANLKAEQAKLDSIGSQDNILKLQGKSEREILQMKIKQTDAVIQATEAQIKQNDITAQAQIAAAKRNKDILKGILDFLSIPFQTVLKTIDMIGKAVGKDFGLAEGFNKLLDKGASLIFDPEAEKQKAEETKQASLKALEKLKNDRAGFQLSIQNIDKQAYDKRKEIQDKEAEDHKKFLDDKLKREQQYREDYQNLQERFDEIEKENAAKLKEEQALVLEDAIAGDNKLLESALATLNGIKANEKLSITERLADNTYYTQQLLSNKQLTQDQIDQINAKSAENEKELNKLKNQAIIADSMNTLSAIAGLAGEGTAIAKAVSVAQATMSGYEGVMNAYKTAQKSPITVFFPAYPVVQAGLAGAFAAMNIRKILSVQKPSISGGAASAPSMSVGGAGGGSAAPQFNVVGNSGVNQLASTLGQQTQQPVQAFVVANQVTTQQALDRNIIQNASLG